MPMRLMLHFMTFTGASIWTGCCALCSLVASLHELALRDLHLQFWMNLMLWLWLVIFILQFYMSVLLRSIVTCSSTWTCCCTAWSSLVALHELDATLLAFAWSLTWTTCNALWSAPACLHELDAALRGLHMQFIMNLGLTLCSRIFACVSMILACVPTHLDATHCDLHLHFFMNLTLRSMIFTWVSTWTWFFALWSSPARLHELTLRSVIFTCMSPWTWRCAPWSSLPFLHEFDAMPDHLQLRVGGRVYSPTFGPCVCPLYVCRVYPRLFWRTAVFDFSRFSGFRVFVFHCRFQLFAVFGFSCSTGVFDFLRFSGFRVFVFHCRFQLFAVFGFSGFRVPLEFSTFRGFRVFGFHCGFRVFAFPCSFRVFGFSGFRGDALAITLFDFSGFRVFAPRPAPVTGNRRHTNPKHSNYISYYTAPNKYIIRICGNGGLDEECFDDFQIYSLHSLWRAPENYRTTIQRFLSPYYIYIYYNILQYILNFPSLFHTGHFGSNKNTRMDHGPTWTNNADSFSLVGRYTTMTVASEPASACAPELSIGNALPPALHKQRSFPAKPLTWKILGDSGLCYAKL